MDTGNKRHLPLATSGGCYIHGDLGDLSGATTEKGAGGHTGSEPISDRYLMTRRRPSEMSYVVQNNAYLEAITCRGVGFN